MDNESKQVSDLMGQIAYFDCQPHVYEVTLKKSDYSSGFSAFVQFRSNLKGEADVLSAHGNTAREALETLLKELTEHFGKCPHCGEYRHTQST